MLWVHQQKVTTVTVIELAQKDDVSLGFIRFSITSKLVELQPIFSGIEQRSIFLQTEKLPGLQILVHSFY